MDNDKKIKIVMFAAILILSIFCFNSDAMHLRTLPAQQKILVGDTLDLGFESREFLQALHIDIEDSSCIEDIWKGKDSLTMASAPVATSPGKVNLYLKLFGIIPLRHVTVDVVPEIKVLPGGQSIGVMLQSHGVIVVGLAAVEDQHGKSYNPAREAGIKVGDVLLRINNKAIETEEQLKDIVSQAGRNGNHVTLKVKRQDKILTVKVKPVYCKETNAYRLGLLIRDSAAGVGTLTFYHQESGIYGALGHIITDSDTGQKIDLSNGRIFEASVQEIHPGRNGHPGEKVGVLNNNSELTGDIRKNTPYGIFGRLNKPISNPYFKEPIPVALPNQIKKGPAEIITVVKDNKMERFKICIEKINRQSRPDGKGIIIKITDPKLLKTTGGIIQGMSGSPIIQYTDNGQPVLVGAVTHVFINDPTRGYAVLAEWMVEETKILSKEIKTTKSLKKTA